MLKSEWVKPGTGRAVGELRQWVWDGRKSGPLPDYYDTRKTALDIVRSGPPEPYDVERVEEAIRRVGVEGQAPVASVPLPRVETEFKVVLLVRTPTEDDGGPNERELEGEIIAALAGRVQVVKVEVQVWDAEVSETAG